MILFAARDEIKITNLDFQYIFDLQKSKLLSADNPQIKLLEIFYTCSVTLG